MRARMWFLAAAVTLALGAVVIAVTLPSKVTPVAEHLPGRQPAPNCSQYAFGCVSVPPTDLYVGQAVDHRITLRLAVAGSGVVLALVLTGVGTAVDRGRPTSA